MIFWLLRGSKHPNSIKEHSERGQTGYISSPYSNMDLYDVASTISEMSGLYSTSIKELKFVFYFKAFEQSKPCLASISMTWEKYKGC